MKHRDYRDTIVSPEYRELEQHQARAVFTLLEDWYQAMDDGSAGNRLPDPAFIVPKGRPEITEDLVERTIAEIDLELEIDAFDRQGKKFGANAATAFRRLEYPQKLALTQMLINVLLSTEQLDQMADAARRLQYDPLAIPPISLLSPSKSP